MTNHIPEMVLAIDFSLDRLDVSLQGDDREWLWAHQAYVNNWPSWQQLKQDLLLELNQASPVRLAVAGESTGPYWWHAFYQLSHDDDLQPFAPELALFNPAASKGIAKLCQNRTKPTRMMHA